MDKFTLNSVEMLAYFVASVFVWSHLPTKRYDRWHEIKDSFVRPFDVDFNAFFNGSRRMRWVHALREVLNMMPAKDR